MSHAEATEVRRDPDLEIHGGAPPALPEATVRLRPAPSPDWVLAFSTATATPSDIAVALIGDTLTFRAAPEDRERVLAGLDRAIRAANEALARR